MKGKSFTVVEFGASGGQLALDILEALSRNHPGLYSKTDYVMSEASPAAVLAAKERLKEHRGRVRWIDDLQQIGKGGFRGVVDRERISRFPALSQA